MTLLLRLLVVAFAVWVVAAVLPGVQVRGEPVDYLVIAVIFAVVNLLVKPVVTLLSLPFVVLTLGLFLLVVNAAMFGLTAALTDRMTVDGFGTAVLAGLIVAAVTWFGDNLLGLED